MLNKNSIYIGKVPYIYMQNTYAKLNIYLLLIQPFSPKEPIRVLEFSFVYCRLDLT